MTHPVIAIGCVANLYSRQMVFEKTGDIEQAHNHAFDHLTLLATGSLKVSVDGKDTVFKAPHMIYIKAEKLHQLEAMEDNTIAYCIHALRNGEGVNDILDPSMVPEGVNPFAAGIANSLVK